MPKIDIDKLPLENASIYPEPFRQLTRGRFRKRLGNAAGLGQFGVNLTTLKAGAGSAQRHWHEAEDEFVYVLSGELVLVEDDGETVLRAGDAAGFKANSGNGHCLINRGEVDAVYLEVGSRLPRERVDYPDIDMRMERDETGMRFLRKNGVPYPGSER